VRRLHQIRGVAIAALLLCGVEATARGDLITTLTVVQDTAPDGLNRYTYTLTNLAASTQPVTLLQIDVATAADLQAISNTIAWDVTYAPGSSNITWTSAIQPDGTTNDLMPGSSGIFSFESRNTPIAQPFLIVGVDPAGGFGGTSEGTVLSPSAVPEPAGIVLFAAGAAGLLVARWRGRGGRP
jgi:hypothetical protein